MTIGTGDPRSSRLSRGMKQGPSRGVTSVMTINLGSFPWGGGVLFIGWASVGAMGAMIARR
jgi:hypothetical protein